MANPCKGTFIAVHSGAGYHSPSREQDYRKVCDLACRQALRLLQKGETALECVTEAVKVLEDSSCTNAGVGSALTMEGAVECDAGVMDGQSLLFGAVGAITNVKNPVCVAKKLVEGQKERLTLGRIPPSVMVGDGASKWAIANGCERASNEELVTESSLKTYKSHKRKLDSSGLKNRKKQKSNDCNNKHECLESSIQDTVGAVCLDRHGNLASAVSSGGISLKHPGRIGQAAVFGAGCWAENRTISTSGIAVCTSGSGEHLMSTLLAHECATAVTGAENASLAVSQTFKEKFLGSKFLKMVDEKFGGVLVLKHDVCDNGHVEVELLWAHTTDSMCIGYMSEKGSKPKTSISRLQTGCIAGKSFNMEGKHFNL